MWRKIRKIIHVILLISFVVQISSCGTKRATRNITYQSVRTTFAQPDKSHPIPKDAEIVVAYTLSSDGDLNAIVFNQTDEIMTIDQTKSFFVNTDGLSTMYYDPVVRTVSTETTHSTNSGNSINLGSVAGVFGIGGVAGALLSGVNVGGGSSDGTSVTEVVRVADMPQVSLSPHSRAAMSKTYTVSNIGEYIGKYNDYEFTSLDFTHDNALCRFSVCISYSIDGGKNYKKIVTYFYANSRIIVPVSASENVNDALRKLYETKTDWANEPFWMISIHRGFYDENVILNGVIYDFQ